MDPRIQVVPAADGGNPRSPHDIIAREDDFLIFPFSEDGDDNYRFHMNARVENRSNETIPVNITVEWGDEIYQRDRNYLLLCVDDDSWQRIETTIDGTRIKGTASVPPGVSHLTLHPRYEHGRLTRLAASLPPDLFTVEVIGKTRMRRDILAIEAGDRSRKPVAFYARVHPYETIGSYFLEGMLKWLGGAEAAAFLAEHHVVFVPMPNTDGVTDGMNKLTHGGLNFSSNFRRSVEPEALAFKGYFAQKAPSVIFDIHGWNNPWDNMVTNDGKIGRLVYDAVLAEERLFWKPTEIHYRPYPWSLMDHSCSHFVDELGVRYFNSSWNHVGRTSADLYAMGVVLLRATAGAARAVIV